MYQTLCQLQKKEEKKDNKNLKKTKQTKQNKTKQNRSKHEKHNKTKQKSLLPTATLKKQKTPKSHLQKINGKTPPKKRRKSAKKETPFLKNPPYIYIYIYIRVESKNKQGYYIVRQ